MPDAATDGTAKVAELVDAARICMLTTMTDDGQHVSRPMALQDVEFDGDPLTIGFNPTFPLDGLAAVHTERARMDFTSALKPAVLSGSYEPAGDGDGAAPKPGSYRYLIMPVRLPG